MRRVILFLLLICLGSIYGFAEEPNRKTGIGLGYPYLSVKHDVSEKISCEEVELYHKKVKKNGIWVFDDTNWDTTKKAQELLVSYGYIEIYDSGTWKIYKRF